MDGAFCAEAACILQRQPNHSYIFMLGGKAASCFDTISIGYLRVEDMDPLGRASRAEVDTGDALHVGDSIARFFERFASGAILWVFAVFKDARGEFDHPPGTWCVIRRQAELLAEKDGIAGAVGKEKRHAVTSIENEARHLGTHRTVETLVAEEDFVDAEEFAEDFFALDDLDRMVHCFQDSPGFAVGGDGIDCGNVAFFGRTSRPGCRLCH